MIRAPARRLLLLLGVATCAGTAAWGAEEERGAGGEPTRSGAAAPAADLPSVRPPPPNGPYRQSVSYDPAKCSPPVTDGKVRIMLGRLVLAWPQDKVAISRGLSREEVTTLPPPPDPSQPEGCPKNPIWGGTFTLTFPYPGMAEDGSEQVEWASTGLVYAQSGRAYVQESNETAARHHCEQAPPGSIKEVLPSGFTVCRYKPEDGRPLKEWGTSFVASLDIYSMPDGRPFIVSCLFGELTSGAHGCPVSYRLYREANVFYKVNFRKTLIDGVITMDKALRSAVGGAIVAEYAWPDGKTIREDGTSIPSTTAAASGSGASSRAGTWNGTHVKNEHVRREDEDSAMGCQEALASEPIRDMDRHLNEIGVHYEEMFDQALTGASCTAEQVANSLVRSGAVLYDFDDYGSWQGYSLRYKPGPFLLRLFRFGFHIVIVGTENGQFQYSNWEVDL